VDIQSALDYSETLFNTLSATDQVTVRTAFGVLINTIDNAVTQSQGPSPEKLAIIALIDERISASQANVYSWIDMWANDNLRDRMMEMLAHDNVDDQISNWMSNNFDLDDYNVDGAIESWMDNNIDDKVYDAVNSISFTVEIGR
jgi:hypothetical protein